MKKILSVLICVLLAVAALLSLAACDNSEETDSLVVYNWADYIYDYEEDFKEYYKNCTGKNIEITYVTFDTNETMLTKITKGDTNVDVICPSEYAIQKLLESDLLVELNYFDEAKYTKDLNVSGYVHNSDNVDGKIVEKINDAFGNVAVGDKTVSMKDYFVPYMYGTLGILYNKEEFKRLGIYDIDKMNKANWGILFNDDGDGNLFSADLTGSILMKDSIRDSYVATIFYLLESGRLDGLRYQDAASSLYGTKYTDMQIGDLINAVDSQLIDLCEKVLVEQKKQLFGYEVDFGKDDLLKGNAMVDLAWSGDALYAVEESWNDDIVNDDGTKGGYELGYFVPHTAGNIWFDGWVVPKTYNPEHLDAIKLFINFLNTPYVAAQNMLEIGYTSAVNKQVVKEDDDARSALAEAYVVNDSSWERENENGEAITEFDYDSWEEFCDYFFDYSDDIDGCNWRYPFEDSSSSYNRGAETLGVMRDFGANNKQVVTMWNYARSAGVSAVPLLLWTLLALAVAGGIVGLYVLVKRLKSKQVVLPNDENIQESADDVL